MQNIDNYNFTDKKAIVRVDFNVPLNANFEVTDNTRIVAALPTIKKIASQGAVILMSHLGRPKTKEEKFSLKHIVPELSKLLGKNVQFIDDCIGENVKSKVAALKNGDVLLLENLRYYPEEKKGDKAFAKQLAELADVYVNDAFGTAHRAHASTTIIAQFFPDNKMFGYLIENELKSLQKVLTEHEKPFTAILGGAKVSSKIIVIEKLLEKVDNLIIAGGMTYTFIKAQGGNIGSSLVEDDYLDMAKELIIKAKTSGINLILPIDSVNADKFAEDANTETTAVNEVKDNWMGLDIGPETVKLFSDIILNSKTVLWNGPAGVFEMDRFAQGTIKIAEALAEATSKGCYTLVGGGDSVAAVKKYHLDDKVSYVSTGGGAMLEFLEGKDLPGIAAMKN
ncbi:MAG: phosphoglycerate kinase [Bacteroidetes bacterium]|nr:MAG: phosphoglycerate kinase [Bacteroidota bacterium]